MAKSEADLHETFGIDGFVAIGPGRGGLTCVKLFYPDSYASAYVYLFGAHITSWVDSTGVSRIFTSENAIFDGNKAIRGGVPVCFPQFGKLGGLMQHGFARNSYWEIESTTVDSLDKTPSVTLLLKSSGATKQFWEHDFELRLAVSVSKETLKSASGSLDCQLKVSNVGSSSFKFSGALHTYLNVPDVRSAAVIFERSRCGTVILEHSSGPVFDNRRRAQYADVNEVKYTDEVGMVSLGVKEVKFIGEVDLSLTRAPDIINLDGSTPTSRTTSEKGIIKVHRSTPRSRTTIEKAGFPDLVVWNPYDEKSAGMADLEDSAWMHFVCVEPAIAKDPITLGQGKTWVGRMRLS